MAATPLEPTALPREAADDDARAHDPGDPDSQRMVRYRRFACAVLGALLLPPDDDHLPRLQLACALLDTPLGAPAAAAALESYRALRSGQSTAELQECYTRTFELSPRCTPYLSVHLFGAESFERSQLMTGLLETYEQIGFTGRGCELADHLGVVLRAAPLVDLELWLELEQLCLRPALAKMLERLQSVPVVPWRYVLEAVAHLLATAPTEAAEDERHA